MANDKTKTKGKILTDDKLKNKNKIRIVFLCTGNTCRSPMAEQIFRDFLRKKKLLSRFDVKSAGLYADVGGCMTDYAAEAVEALGIKPKKHTPRQFTPRLNSATDLIICVTEKHKNLLDEKTRAKAVSLAELSGSDLNDPYGSSRAQYDKAAQYLSYACQDILDFLQKIN